MSYARIGEDSDVYVYSDGEKLHCQCCTIELEKDKGEHTTGDLSEMLRHLEEHAARGEKVPAYAISRLEGDVAAGKLRSLRDIGT